ncbi:sulfatase [Catenovulum agarivorans DS-2]|uniref:Sulfatase n=1 Tax=Catenovulum agarivorans DS-2 TaxID=1328313 RepID=W7QAF4_9ALTE|nr:arylsulfatase [Catenovulum agarivorans]EWH09789.1 sulfatase [Catenovulum agarivorans DS-2]
MRFIKSIIDIGIISSILLLLPSCSSQEQAKEEAMQTSDKPNIVIFYVDDLGYGDLGAYGATAVKTPNVDALAHNGIRFTDAHSSAATCTPSRYSLLTGEQAFRNKRARILPGDAPLLIDVNQPTLPKMLKKVGYKTAVVGKWHLGLGDGFVDWNKAVKPGPLEIGFDYSFLLPATGDRVPSVYLENHHVVNLSQDDPLYVNYKHKIGNRPTGYENPELVRQTPDEGHNKTIVNGISRMGWMACGKSAEWIDEDFYQVFTDKANDFITANKEQPFFLFFPFHDIHVPRLPHKMFQGQTDMGPRGDAIVQMDWITGQIVNQLKKYNLLDNTIILFTSDNGAVLNDGYEDQAEELLGEHKPNGIYKGGKYSAHEAGTRVPTIIHYPNRVKPGVSDALMTQVDIYASLANYLNIPLENQEAIDSQVLTDAWFNAQEPGRDFIIQQSVGLALRMGSWKYITPANENRMKRKAAIKERKNIDIGAKPTAQLYNLTKDPSEQIDLAARMPEKVAELAQLLAKEKARTARKQ